MIGICSAPGRLRYKSLSHTRQCGPPPPYSALWPTLLVRQFYPKRWVVSFTRWQEVKGEATPCRPRPSRRRA